MDDRQFMEGIDACRPGSNDHAAPELAGLAQRIESDPAARRLFERVQKFDARLGQRVQDMPVPADLSNRLLARLAEAAATMATGPMATGPLAVEPVSLSQPAGERGWSRRRWLAAVGAVAASLIVAAFGVKAILPPKASPSDPAEAVAAWESSLTGKWKAVADAPKGFAVPSVITTVGRGWQRIDSRTVAFKLTPPGGAAATLYVTRRILTGMPSGPPAVPQSSTGGRSIGAWQTGGLVYVLVVEADERHYQRLIKSTSAPLA